MNRTVTIEPRQTELNSEYVSIFRANHSAGHPSYSFFLHRLPLSLLLPACPRVEENHKSSHETSAHTHDSPKHFKTIVILQTHPQYSPLETKALDPTTLPDPESKLYNS